MQCFEICQVINCIIIECLFDMRQFLGSNFFSAFFDSFPYHLWLEANLDVVKCINLSLALELPHVKKITFYPIRLLIASLGNGKFT